MKKVCFISSSRADFGLLKNLILKMKTNKSFSVKVIASGTHFSKFHGFTIKDFKKNKIKIDGYIKCNPSADNVLNISSIMSKSIIGSTKLFKKLKPDIIVVVGDRYEILASVISAHLMRIPVAHLHGGEITHGALDDAFRHSITKMSQIHFVANKKYKQRVIQLGEEPKNVHIVGGLGIDNISKTKLLSKKTLEKKFKLKFLKKNFMICFHPETMNKNSTKKQIKIILQALKKLKNSNLIFTMPGADLENKIIISEIKKFVKKNRFSYFFKSLGDVYYYSFLSNVDCMIGNSSSGVLEMPYFKKGTINLGDRQSGRLFSNTIRNSEISVNQILKNINYLFSEQFKTSLKKKIYLPYGKPGAVNKIFSILKKKKTNKLFNKKFYDLNL